MLGRSHLVQVHPFRWGLASMGLGVFLLLADSGGYVGTRTRRGGRNPDRPHGHDHRRHCLRDRRSAAPVGSVCRRARPALPRCRPPRPHRRPAPRRATVGAEDRPLALRLSRSGRGTTTRPSMRSQTSRMWWVNRASRRCSSMDEPTSRDERATDPLRAAYTGQGGLPPARAVDAEARTGSGGEPKSDVAARSRKSLTRALADFGVDARVVGEITGPRVTRYELRSRPGRRCQDLGAQGRSLVRRGDDEIRILAPIHGKQAVGVGSRPLAEPRHARRRLRHAAGDGQPAVGLARQGHLRQRRLDRPRADAAPPIAGTTGAGKSGCINTILTSVRSARPPTTRASSSSTPSGSSCRSTGRSHTS